MGGHSGKLVRVLCRLIPLINSEAYLDTQAMFSETMEIFSEPIRLTYK